MVYLVTWEFNKKRLTYPAKRARLNAAFKNLTWIKDPGLDSVVFVSYLGNSTQLYNYLIPCFDRFDRLVVSKITATQATTLLLAKAQAWINARL